MVRWHCYHVHVHRNWKRTSQRMTSKRELSGGFNLTFTLSIHLCPVLVGPGARHLRPLSPARMAQHCNGSTTLAVPLATLHVPRRTGPTNGRCNPCTNGARESPCCDHGSPHSSQPRRQPATLEARRPHQAQKAVLGL